MTNQKIFPSKNKTKQECREQGVWVWCQCSKTGTVAIGWTEQSPVYFLSDAHLPHHNDSTVEQTEDSGSKVSVNATPSTKGCNEFMDGVDLNTKMCKLDQSGKSFRWYIKIDQSSEQYTTDKCFTKKGSPNPSIAHLCLT